MPKYTYKDQEALAFELLPNGDYILEVVGYECTISNTPKTRGSEVITVKVRAEGRHAVWKEKLILHPSCDWKIDVFLKCMNAAPVKGMEIDLAENMIMGLRGWATVGQREYKAQSGEMKKTNEVVAWITNKEKLTRATQSLVRTEDDDVPF